MPALEPTAPPTATPAPDSLRQWREQAAIASGGTSSDAIKDHVMSLLSRHQRSGSVLDFGAGTGELLARLLDTRRYSRLAGVDLYERPDWLPEDVAWWRHDLNDPMPAAGQFDAVVCSEVVEHLENPRQVFRSLASLVAPGGLLIVTTPNIECLRSLGGLLLRGHYTPFLNDCYPAHITALLRLDFERLCGETGFERPVFSYPDDGAVPKLPHLRWKTVSAGLLRGRLFSDTVALHTRRRA